jgi:hypothetical protein
MNKKGGLTCDENNLGEPIRNFVGKAYYAR